jgi:hypothetical protein
MAKFWFWLCVFCVVTNVIDAVRLSFFGYELPIFSQVFDQLILTLLFTGLALDYYVKGRE